MAPDISRCAICETKFVEGEEIYWVSGEWIFDHAPNEKCLICSSCKEIHGHVIPVYPFCIYTTIKPRQPAAEAPPPPPYPCLGAVSPLTLNKGQPQIIVNHVECDPAKGRCECDCPLCPVRNRCRRSLQHM